MTVYFTSLCLYASLLSIQSMFMQQNNMRYEVFMVMKIQVMVFWNMILISYHITTQYHNSEDLNLNIHKICRQVCHVCITATYVYNIPGLTI